MKVTVINGQNHKGSTYNIGKLLTEKLGERTNIEEVNEFFLPRDMDKDCIGCNKCFMESETKCPAYEKLKPITEKLDSADLLIFTTPVYVMHCTGPMKRLLDHYGYRFIIHRPEKSMFSKQAVVISTAAGGGTKSANKDIKDSLKYWGIGKIYTLGFAIHATSWKEVMEREQQYSSIEKKVNKVVNKIISKDGRVKGSLFGKMLFTVFRKMNLKQSWNETDTSYWRSMGWLDDKRPWK